MTVKLLTELHLEFQSLKGGCTGSSESTLVKEITCRGSYRVRLLTSRLHTSITNQHDTLPCTRLEYETDLHVTLFLCFIAGKMW